MFACCNAAPEDSGAVELYNSFPTAGTNEGYPSAGVGEPKAMDADAADQVFLQAAAAAGAGPATQLVILTLAKKAGGLLGAAVRGATPSTLGTHEVNFGFELTVVGNQFLSIAKVTDGLLEAYNAKAPRNLRVYAGDLIVEVNGKTTHAEMVQALGQGSLWNITAERRHLFEVELRRPSGETLGMALNCTKGPSDVHKILISDMKEGVVTAHNAKHPEHAIKVGHRILEVNDKRIKFDDMAVAIKEASTLTLVLRRTEEAGNPQGA
mmetsp:Transcript_115820/g.368243  ORF Transcript_115820/g.368243 Transcript_115820/m.368243 type:complete len:266 (-) Transcript_115820:386-1183(-)